jgi:hypothetical protein
MLTKSKADTKKKNRGERQPGMQTTYRYDILGQKKKWHEEGE